MPGKTVGGSTLSSPGFKIPFYRSMATST